MWPKQRLKTICEARKQQITQSHHVWVFESMTAVYNWWQNYPNLTDCSQDDIETSLNRSFLFGVETFTDDNVVTPSGEVSICECRVLFLSNHLMEAPLSDEFLFFLLY